MENLLILALSYTQGHARQKKKSNHPNFYAAHPPVYSDLFMGGR
jgi:hypothetical protein